MLIHRDQLRAARAVLTWAWRNRSEVREQAESILSFLTQEVSSTVRWNRREFGNDPTALEGSAALLGSSH